MTPGDAKIFVRSSPELFFTWLAIASKTRDAVFKNATVVQNDVAITDGQYEEWLEDVHKMKNEIDEDFKNVLHATVQHIKRGR